MNVTFPFPLSGVSIMMKRRPCFGTCPVYSVAVSGDGEVVYQGEMFVRAVGERRRTISRESVFTLVAEALDIGFFDLRDHYAHGPVFILDEHGMVQECDHFATDLATCEVRVQLGDYSKSILDYCGAPTRLRMFERLIDRVCGTAEWVHSGEDESSDPLDSFRSSRTKKSQSIVKAAIGKRLREFQERLIQIFKPPHPGS